MLFELHNPKIDDLKAVFAQGFNAQTANYYLINKFVVQKFNQYIVLNVKGYRFWNCIQIDFEKFEAKYFDKMIAIYRQLLKTIIIHINTRLIITLVLIELAIQL